MRNISGDDVLLLDSSVVMKWFRSEADFALARELRKGHLSGRWEIRLADLVLYETGNALLYSGDFSADEVIQSIESVLQLELILYAFDHPIFKRALQISSAHGVAIYDSYLVALAEIENLIFVTADERLLQKITDRSNTVGLNEIRLSDVES